MSRVINVDATQAEVLAACARRGAAVSAIEDLVSGGTRVVLMNADATSNMTRVFGRKVLTGEVRRRPLRGWAL